MREPGDVDPVLEAWRKTYARIQVEGSGTCPPDERLASLAIGELAGAERVELMDHVVSCAHCSRATKDLLALHHESRRRWPRARIALAAAVAVIAIGVPVVLMNFDGRTPEPRSSMRGATPGTTAIVPEDRATLAAAPARLSWPNEAGADGYQVVLYDAESTPIWESPIVVAPELSLPEAARTALRPGNDYYWRVTTLVGIDRRPSALRRFHLAP